MKTLTITIVLLLLSGVTSQAQLWKQKLVMPGSSFTAYTFSYKGKLFAGTLGIKCSSDDAETWTDKNEGLSKALVRIYGFGKSSNNLWVGTEDGLYRSEDVGDNWKASNNGIDSGIIIDQVVQIDGRCFALTASSLFSLTKDHELVFISDDEGSTWSKSNSGLDAKALAKSLIKFDNKLWLATSVGLFTSSDQGDTWTEVATPSRKNDIRLVEAVGDRLFMITDKFYISDDKGSSWTEKAITPKVPNVSNGYSFIDSKDTLILMHPSGVLKSGDKGDSWEEISANFKGTTNLEMVTKHGQFLYLTWNNRINQRAFANSDEVSTNKISDLAWSIYPNPAVASLTLNSDEQFLKIELKNLEGRSIHYVEGYLANSNLILPSNLASGLYRIVVRTESGKMGSKLIYVQN